MKRRVRGSWRRIAFGASAVTLSASAVLAVVAVPQAAAAPVAPTNSVSDSSSAGFATVGTSIVFTATVSGPAAGATPTGTITWTVAGTAGVSTCASTTPLAGSGNSATASCTVTASAAGTYRVKDAYPGDTNYTALTSGNDTVTATTLATPTDSVANSGTTFIPGSIVFTATVINGLAAAQSPSGVVTWNVSGTGGATSCALSTPLTPVVATPGTSTATCTVTVGADGTYRAVAAVAADANDNAVSSNRSSVTIALVNPTNAVTFTSSASNGKPHLGDTLTFTATVSGPNGAPVPTGTVTFAVTGSGTPDASSTCTSTTPVALVAGVATCTIIADAVGTYIVNDAYTPNGDLNYSSDATTTKSANTATVPMADPTNVVTFTSSASNGKAHLGDTLTFTDTVTGPPGAPVPTGTVDFAFVSQLNQGTPDPASTCLTNGTGLNLPGTVPNTVSCTIIVDSTGLFAVTATYNGDSTYKSSVSNVDASNNPNVGMANPNNVVTNDSTNNQSSTGTTVTFTATVSGPAGAPAPSGAVMFAVTGTGTPDASSTCTSSTPVNLNQGVGTSTSTATCTIVGDTAGTYTVTNTYGGDQTYNSSTSSSSANSATVTIATASLASNNLTDGGGSLGGSITYTATLTGIPGGPAPSGTVSWSVNGPGSINNCDSKTSLQQVGTTNVSIATCTVDAPAAGNYAVSETTKNDPFYSTSTSNPNPDSVTVAKASVPSNVVTDDSGTNSDVLAGSIIYTATVTGVTGGPAPTGALTWILNGSPAVCTNSPSTLIAGAGNVSTATCTVSVPAAGNYTVSDSVAADSNYKKSTSNTDTVAIAQGTLTNGVSDSVGGIGSLGDTAIFTATVTGPVGGPTPVGTVSWNVSGTGGATACSSSTALVGNATNHNVATATCTVDTPAAGTYIVSDGTAVDGNYLASSSSADTVTVGLATPTIVVTDSSSPNPASFESTIVYTATLTTTNFPTATGSVTWTVSGTGGATTCASDSPLTATSTLVSTATCTVDTTGAGDYTVRVDYSGDGNYNTVLSPPDVVGVDIVTPTTVVTDSAASHTASIGDIVIFTDTVTAPSGDPTPTGAVTWVVTGTAGVTTCTSSTTSLSGSANAATAICGFTFAAAGTYVVQANYFGDGNYSGIDAQPDTVTVSKATPSVSIGDNGSTPPLGSTIVFPISVTGGGNNNPDPSGSITWNVSGTAGATACSSTTPLVAGSFPGMSTASCTITGALAGTYAVSASYGGDANYNSADSITDTVTVAKATPVVNVIDNTTGEATTTGSTVVFTATVNGSGGSADPVGTINWTVTGTGGATTCSSVTPLIPSGAPDTSAATCTIDTIGAGTYIVSVSYGGDTNFNSASSGTDTVTATTPKLTPVVTIIDNATGGATTTGSTVVFTTTVNGTGGPADPTGTITWTVSGSGGATACTSTTPLAAAANPATSQATCTIHTTTAGTYIVSAGYGGDTNFNSATSGTDTVTATGGGGGGGKTTPTVVVTDNVSGTTTIGSTVVFTATVTGSGGNVPTGSITWTVGGSAGVTVCTTTPLATGGAANTATATCTLTASAGGTYIVSAAYNGDGNYNSAASGNDTVTATTSATPTVTITDNVSGVTTPGSTVVFTAIVHGTGSTDPTGTITWTVTGPGSVHVCTSTTPLVAGSTPTASATCTITNLVAGTYTASASYSGDTTYAAATSGTDGVSVASLVSTPPPPPPPPPAVGGYTLVASDGGIFTYGNEQFYGSTGNLHLNKPIVGMARTPDGKGYWLVASDGGVFTFGDAVFHGSTGNLHLVKPIVGMVATPDGGGYWLVASDGGVFTFGDAVFYGSTGGTHLNKPIVGMISSPDGHGYLLVASDGGVFTFGDATFHGSTGNLNLVKPIVGIVATPDGGGYWLVASDGGVFTFGDAVFHGSTGGLVLNKPIVAIVPTAGGGGYWLIASDGGVFTFGDAAFDGSAGGAPLNKPIVGAAGG